MGKTKTGIAAGGAFSDAARHTKKTGNSAFSAGLKSAPCLSVSLSHCPAPDGS